MLKLQHKILLLDDEPSNLGLLERIFSRNPHQLFKTETPEEAFEVLENHDISVVISDYRMPAMTGIEFLKEVEQHHPTVVRILCTGLADLNEFKEALTSGLLYGYIVKPFKIFEISLLVERALELYELTKERDKLKQDWEITKRETTALLEAGTSVSSSRDVNLTLSRLVRAICTNFGYQCCSIELIDRTTWELYIKASYGFPIEVQKKRLPIEGRGVVCYVARTGKQICLNNASADERYVPN
ncbi:MAG: response regulator, partial [Blastocatellia bacterium]|nr:response regulator [Blastocatellia bacterium]